MYINILLFLSTLTCIVPKMSFDQSLNSVFLEGSIININNQMEVEDMSDLGTISPPNLANTFVPDSAGNFTITMPLSEAGYYRIGRNILYLSPGDTLEVELDFNKPEYGIFKGNSAMAQHYLRNTPYPMAGSYAAYEENMGATVRETIEKIVQFGADRDRELISLPNLTPKFLLLEKARIRADIINSIMDIFHEYPYFHKLKDKDLASFHKSFNDSLNGYIKPFITSFIDPEWMQLSVYQKIAYKVLELNEGIHSAEALSHIEQWHMAKACYRKVLTIDKKANNDSLKMAISQITEFQYKEKLLESFEMVMQFGNGSFAKKLVGENSDGLAVTLEQYRGKIIFIDFWATWCGPCIKAFPVFDEIKEKFKGDSTIIFLTISIDDNKEKWRQSLGKYNLTEPQWIVDRLAIPEYRIVNVPRTLIIDKSFSIYAFQGPNPERKDDIEEMLKRLKN